MKKFDVALTWHNKTNEKFIGWLKRECEYRHLAFILITRKNVESVISGLEKSKLKIKFILDNQADYFNPKDPFVRLCYAVKDAGGYVVCDPDDARHSSNKAITHYELLKANIPVPFSVVVRNWEPKNFKLTKEESKNLKKPFIIKPATGFGQRGVVKDAKGSIEEIARARHYNEGDDFLLQEKIEPVTLGDKMAWFRVYYLFGEIIPCWWNTSNGWYGHISLREMYNFRLLPLARITSEIARTTNMEFFTTEIAMTNNKEKKFVSIDYVNDQPDLCVLGEKAGGGPVPSVVEHIAERIAGIAWRISKGFSLNIHRSIWLGKAILEDSSI